jgi:hypothetical protein
LHLIAKHIILISQVVRVPSVEVRRKRNKWEYLDRYDAVLRISGLSFNVKGQDVTSTIWYFAVHKLAVPQDLAGPTWVRDGVV